MSDAPPQTSSTVFWSLPNLHVRGAPASVAFHNLAVASMQFMLVQWSGSTSFTRPLISNTELHFHGVGRTPDIYMFRSFTSSPLSSLRERALLAVMIGAFKAYVYAFNFSTVHSTT